MKNKEIEELLNTMKNKECYYVGTNGCLYQDLTKEEINLILSFIEQLETDCKEANESVTWWQNRFNAVERDKKQLENNRDKAIEIIDLITPELWNISNAMTYKLKDIKYILKGGSDE